MTTDSVVSEPAGGWREPWPQVFELATALPVDRWALVGGLMVQAHALAASIDTTRVTIDVDAAVRIEAGTYWYSDAVSALAGLDYIVDTSTRLTYRFRRGTEVVDLMVPDHDRPRPSHAGRGVMQVSGGTQAMDRLEVMNFRLDAGQATVPLPNLHGAIVLKAAAHMEDSRDRDRHLLDAVTLLACIEDIQPIVDGLQGSDRRRILHVLRSLHERPLVVGQAPADTRLLAERTADDLRRALS